jgi:diguanylate cyclase (GGDEF)-like protein
MEGGKKNMDSSTQAGSGTGFASWYQSRNGGLAVWRTLLVMAFLTAVSAVIAVSAGMSSGATAAIMVLLAVTLVHALVLTPVARLTLAGPAAKGRAKAKESDADEAVSGIANRRGITAALLNAMAYANRYNHPLSVAKIEIELLRDIGSALGRRAGDRALQTVASVFLETLRMPDRAGRFGDEDFLIILPHTLLKNANQIAERIRNRIEHVESASGRNKLPLTVNIGIAQFRKGEDLERFLSRVDKALSDAKKSGHKRAPAARSA